MQKKKRVKMKMYTRGGRFAGTLIKHGKSKCYLMCMAIVQRMFHSCNVAFHILLQPWIRMLLCKTQSEMANVKYGEEKSVYSAYKYK